MDPSRIKKWLEKHKEELAASHVYKAWLDAGGDKETIWDSLTSWLTIHHASESANYVMGAVAKQPNLPPEIIKNILTWCRTFPTHDDTLWRITQLRANLQNTETISDVCNTAEVLILHIINSEKDINELKNGQITTLLSYVSSTTKNNTTTEHDQVNNLLTIWIKHPSSFGRKPKPHNNIQRLDFFQRMLSLLDSCHIDIVQDKDSIQRFLAWADEWDANWKKRLKSTIKQYADRFPDRDIWGIIHF